MQQSLSPQTRTPVTFVFRATGLLALTLLVTPAVTHAQLIRSGTGANPAAIQAIVDQFRADLGGGNVPGANGSFGGVRREINWDGVPDNFSAPNNLPADFFNVNSPRGAVFSTSGTGFQVSADASNPTSTPVEFGNINPQYPTIFQTFSPERLFTSLGSNIMDVNFFVAGTNIAARTRGFGVIFTDVDVANTTSLQLFDTSNNSLGTFFVPSSPGSGNLSFLGISFPNTIPIARVRIVSGNIAVGANVNDNNGDPNDVVVMDDFIYGEAVSVAAPEPGSLALGLTGLLSSLGLARSRRRK